MQPPTRRELLAHAIRGALEILKSLVFEFFLNRAISLQTWVVRSD